MIWKKETKQGKVGVEATYVHSDVNYPLRHCLIEQHGLSLAPGVSAEQPKHNSQGVSDTADDKTTVHTHCGRGQQSALESSPVESGGHTVEPGTTMAACRAEPRGDDGSPWVRQVPRCSPPTELQSTAWACVYSGDQDGSASHS